MPLSWSGVGDDHELKHMKWLKSSFVFDKDNRIPKIARGALKTKNFGFHHFKAIILIFHYGIVWGYKVHIDIVQFIAAEIGFDGICHMVFTEWISSVIEFTKVFLFQSVQQFHHF